MGRWIEMGLRISCGAGARPCSPMTSVWPGARRRTVGLRREEVAALAHVSTDFYARLEQRRGSRPSEQTTAAIARALRLRQDERDHLFVLAGHSAPLRAYRTDHVSPH
jgi:transcriptional regulator with XRE-family HTH domain